MKIARSLACTVALMAASAKSLGDDEESNWLPAPNGAFSLYILAYWADQAVLDGQWKPPIVSRMQ